MYGNNSKSSDFDLMLGGFICNYSMQNIMYCAKQFTVVIVSTNKKSLFQRMGIFITGKIRKKIISLYMYNKDDDIHKLRSVWEKNRKLKSER